MPQFAGVFKSYHLSGRQNDGIPGLGIPSLPLPLLLQREFAEATYEYILTAFKRFLDGFEKGVSHLQGLFFGVAHRVANGVCDVSFGKSHGVFYP